MFKIIFSLVLMCSFSFSTTTECVKLKGQLKGSKGVPIKGRKALLVYQGPNLLLAGKCSYDGKFDLKFCPGDGTGYPIDVFVVSNSGDTLLLASIISFENEVQNIANLYLPKRVEKNVICPTCKKKDRLYSLTYKAENQKDLEMHPSKIYCLRDKTRFR